MKLYVVVYLSPGGTHTRYRCLARNKKAARKICKEQMGLIDANIIEIYEEE